MLSYLRLIALLFLVSSLFSIFSCQNASPPQSVNNLYADYFIRYLASEKQLRAEATFAEGDSLQNAIPKTFPSVFFQGEAMDQRDLGPQGIRYKAERGNDNEEEYVFVIKDKSGEEQKFTMELPKIEDFKVGEAASISKGFPISWTGQPLSNDEELVIMLTDKDSKANVVQIKGPSTSNQVDISPRKLSNMVAGKYSVYLVRKQTGRKDNPQNYATYSTEYYTPSLSFQLMK
ncbi:MAG: hypothetical protein AAFP19_06905 [Bacteroidota bacterium]